jgi:hypothetical protein
MKTKSSLFNIKWHLLKINEERVNFSVENLHDFVRI